MVHLAGPEDKFCCTKCRSCHMDVYKYEKKKYISCLDCGHEEEYSEKMKYQGEKKQRKSCC